MKIGVMGSGGVGGYFGARLALGGADVTFVARGAHLSAMQFGEYGGSASARAFASLHARKRGGINAEISDAIRRVIWEKCVFLVGLSGTTTSMRKRSARFARIHRLARFFSM